MAGQLMGSITLNNTSAISEPLWISHPVITRPSQETGKRARGHFFPLSSQETQSAPNCKTQRGDSKAIETAHSDVAQASKYKNSMAVGNDEQATHF